MQGSTTGNEPGEKGSGSERVEGPAQTTIGGLAEVRSTVRVRDVDGDEDYTLVESSEADATRGLISIASPVGRALLGHRSGDVIDVRTPGGMRRLTVVDVSVGATALDRLSDRR